MGLGLRTGSYDPTLARVHASAGGALLGTVDVKRNGDDSDTQLAWDDLVFEQRD
jgi:hypothetical protein